MARALYIHWPFCLKKCPYCDFNSHVRSSVDHDIWLGSMLSDMRHEAKYSTHERLDSIFFGGGTPSLMPPTLVESLLHEAERLWGFSDAIEITLEGNPSSVEAENYADLAKAGINRASLGLQSLDDAQLAFLGRLHNASEGLAALDVAQKHFNRVSFDLIYALPDQTTAQWEAILDRAIGLGTGHLSLYQLTIEPGTRFATDVRNGGFTPLDNDLAAELFVITRSMTKQAGLPAYEISNHAAAGQESRHNLTYWRYADYYGIGPGAHGRRGGIATIRHRKPENWLDAIRQHGHGIAQEHSLGVAEQLSEAILMGLRLEEGIDLEALASRFGTSASDLVNPDKRDLFIRLGLLHRKGKRLGLTDKGMPLLDAVLADLVSDALVTS
ncbi:MAG: radical SAM family heme chaperone HemW [Sphingomonadaceae bacterium]